MIFDENSRQYSPKIEEVALVLREEYRDFAHHNKKNPLDELFFILCSVKRSEKVYSEAFKSLKRNFPRYEQLATASINKISGAVSWGGLQNQKATAAKEIVRRLIEHFGRPTLSPLKKMSDEDCERFLASLPGVGEKVARCVMLYSFDRQVFPVDAHCWRMAKRLNWAAIDDNPTAKNVDRLQEQIPRDLRFSLHVNMVSHGRKICVARSPKCRECVIVSFCRNGKDC
jgi:endonuclease III